MTGADQVVVLFRAVHTHLKIKLALGRAETSLAVARRADGDRPDTAAVAVADEGLQREILRLGKAVQASKELAKVKTMELPEVHLDAYETSVRLTVEKHGADPKQRDVAKALGGLRDEADRLALTYHNLNQQAARVIDDQRSRLRLVRRCRAVWGDAAKAFLAAATTASALPQTSGLTPKLWGNMQACQQLERQLGIVERGMRSGERVLRSGKAEIEDRLYFIGEHQRMYARPRVLETL